MEDLHGASIKHNFFNTKWNTLASVIVSDYNPWSPFIQVIAVHLRGHGTGGMWPIPCYETQTCST